MYIKVLNVETEKVMIAKIETFLTIHKSDVGIVLLPDGNYAAVLLKYGLIIKDTVAETSHNAFCSFEFKRPSIKHWAIIGAETGAAGFCEKLKIDYPLNPEYR